MTPNGRYLYASPTHREALASLFYGIRAGAGFMVLTGQPGMGKTTLLLEALNELREERKVVFLFQTISSPLELIRALLIDLEEVDPQGSLVDLQTKLNEVLVSLAATGKTLVVFIDEAQHLGEPTFEFVRMLSNFETASSKLMQIVLCGQPQLIEALNSSSLLQLRQRVSIFARLDGFSPSETRAYIEHRLKVAGHNPGTELFTEPAMELIVEHGKGIPRNINNICFNALSLAYALRQSRIDADLGSRSHPGSWYRAGPPILNCYSAECRSAGSWLSKLCQQFNIPRQFQALAAMLPVWSRSGRASGCCTLRGVFLLHSICSGIQTGAVSWSVCSTGAGAEACRFCGASVVNIHSSSGSTVSNHSGSTSTVSIHSNSRSAVSTRSSSRSTISTHSSSGSTVNFHSGSGSRVFIHSGSRSGVSRSNRDDPRRPESLRRLQRDLRRMRSSNASGDDQEQPIAGQPEEY